METLNFKVSSKKVVVATIDYSELEELQKGRILKPCDIIKIVEDALECKLPQYDICAIDDRNKVITLYAHVNWVKKLLLYEGYSHHAAQNQNSIQLQKTGEQGERYHCERM